MRTYALFATFLLLAAGCAPRGAGPRALATVTVEAGAFDRVGTVTSFSLPDGLAGPVYRLVDDGGRALPLQVDDAGRAWFILDRLPAGEARTYRLVPGAAPAAPVTVARGGGAVAISVDGQPLLTYHSRPVDPPPGVDPVYRRGGYIHPVQTPSGLVVTDDYPPNHLHHHGIWAAWTRTQFDGRTPDFWNMGERTGTVEPVALEATWSGPVHGGLRARHRYVDLTAAEPVVALDETWSVVAYNVRGRARPYRVFDLEVLHTTASEHPLRLPEYHYGGVGFRGNRQWDGKEHTFFLTSEGRDRSDGHATRARWCHISGYVDGHQAGVAILDHPDNFRAPQPMRIHPTEPFFNYAPSQAGEWAIEPGRPFRARYRYVVSDGPPDAREIDRLWNDFAHPPTVTVRADGR